MMRARPFYDDAYRHHVLEQQQAQQHMQPQGQKAEPQGPPQEQPQAPPQQQSGLSALLRRQQEAQQQEAQQEQAQQEQAMEEAKEEAAREASLTAAYAEWLSAGASPICSIWSDAPCDTRCPAPFMACPTRHRMLAACWPQHASSTRLVA